jgi:hypothetical protein
MVRDLVLDMNSSFASQLRYILSGNEVLHKVADAVLRSRIGAIRNTLPAAEATAV